MTGRAARKSVSLLITPGRTGEVELWGPCACLRPPQIGGIRGARGRSDRGLSFIKAITITISCLDGQPRLVFREGGLPAAELAQRCAQIPGRSIPARRI